MSQLRLNLFVAQGQIVPNEARQILTEICPSVALDLSIFDIDDHAAIRTLLEEQADIVALPLYRSSAFYRAVPQLRRASTIVHLTDGLGDQFSMWELQRAVLAKSRVKLIKGIAVMSLLQFCRADIEFSQFYPRISPYAKRSLPVGPFPMTKAKQSFLSSLFDQQRPDTLIIEGFDLTAERIAEETGIERYIATKRSGGLNVSGQTYLANQVVCAEEVLELMRPTAVIGCPSTSLVAARLVHEGLPVMCITTPEATKVRGLRFNQIYRRHARHYGVTFAKSEVIDQQFAEMRRWLEKRRLVAADDRGGR